jgi:hypothetical protein
LRLIVRPFIVFLLTASLLDLSVFGSVVSPLGVVVTSENAHVDDANVATGTNVFAGDYLQTDKGGTLRLKIGSSQFYLSSASSAILLQEQRTLRMKLTQGKIGFSSAVAGDFEIETPVAMVRAAKGKAALGEVTLVGPHQIMVAAYRGSLVIANAGVERTIVEGTAYNVSLAQGTGTANDDSAGNGSGNGNGNGNNQGGGYPVHNYGPLIFTTVFAGGLSGLGYTIWHFATESNYVPASN